MNSSDPNSKLPTWIFITTDLALIATAAAIVVWSPHPLPLSSIIWSVACVGLGAIVGLVPLLVGYERQKNEILDERQRELEALARTIHGSAEHISIATKGLHEVAEIAQKNLRMAEQLPHKLQDKMAEFQSQLAASSDAEKEELERELLSLRTTESERLESVSQRIAKSSAEWSKLEAATQQHLAAANEAVSKLAFGTASAIGKAQVAAEQALTQARVEASRMIGEATGNATRTIESAKAAALSDLDARLNAAVSTIVDRVAQHVREQLPAPPKVSPAPTEKAPEASTAPSTNDVAASADDTNAGSPPTPTASVAQPPKRPRKTRRDDQSVEVAEPPTAAAAPASSAANAPAPAPAVAEEPQPIPAHTIPEITPVAPSTAEPFVEHPSGTTNGSAAPVTAPADAAVATEAAKPASRKRTAKKADDEDPALALELEQPTRFASNATERVLTSDGATRLLVTAYIGIGNRLFIRGKGPGLTWEKGVPLQFVSIGKWRWETNDADAPVQFKLYKNDDVECAALGAISLDPGHQQEVTAAF